jgi:hypothetical protein
MVEHLERLCCVGERRACRVLRVPRATYQYRSCLDPRTELRMRIREIAQSRVRYGYGKIRVLLNREGWNVGQVSGVPVVLRRRLMPAAHEARRQAQGIPASRGEVQGYGS